MSFEETRCYVIYDTADGAPDCYYCGGTNVSIDCNKGTIEFRKDPTGILLHSEKCKACLDPYCRVCTILRNRNIPLSGRRLPEVYYTSNLVGLTANDGDVVYVAERLSDFVYHDMLWRRRT